MVKVIRAKVGDTFYAVDGTGKKYRAVIETISSKKIQGIISNVTRLENEPFHNVTLAMGLCRPAKLDYIIEKGTEIGVSSFVFFYSEKSYYKLNELKSLPGRLSRFKRLAGMATKQSKRCVIPQIYETVTFEKIIDLSRNYDLALVAENHNSSKKIENIEVEPKDIKNILLVVGPESGLTDDEIENMLEHGFVPISLGSRRLRAETAGVIFPALVLNYLGGM